MIPRKTKPLSVVKIKGIAKAAEIKSANETSTAKEAEEFSKDYTEIITILNEQIDGRLEDFKSEAITLLREAYPTGPSGVLSVISEEKDKIIKITQDITEILETIKYPPFRKCASQCIKDIVDICTEAVCEQYIRAEARAKVKLQ